MTTKMTPVKDHDSLFLFQTMKALGVSQRGLSMLMNSSNAVNYWANGYRKIPSSFKRYMLVLRFVKEKGLLEELKEFIKKEERNR